MKRKLLFLTAFLAVGALGMRAQTDVTSTYLTNADFESGTAATANVTTYVAPSSWTLVNGTHGSSSTAAYGSSFTVNKVTPPSTSDATTFGSNCYIIQGAWSANNYIYQTATLPAGIYRLIYYVQNINSAKTINANNTGFYVSDSNKSFGTVSDLTNASTSAMTEKSVDFTLAEESAVQIRVGYTATNVGSDANKTSALAFDNITLYYTPFATSSDYEALNSAISTVEGKSWGFDAGEYAPYNYVELLEALATAKAIDQTANNSQVTIQNLTSTLNGATWNANEGEVNAIFDGSFEHDYSGLTGNVQPIGWYCTKGTTGDGYNVRYVTSSGNAGLATVGGYGMFTKFAAYYGWGDGYTMPLNASSYYTISFKYGGWGDCKKDGYVTMTDPASASLSLLSSDRLPLSSTDANSNTESWTNYSAIFKTNDAGNYVLGLRKDNENQQSQYVYGNFVLKTTTVSEATTYYNTVLAEVDDSYDEDANAGAAKTAFKNAIDANLDGMTVTEIMEAAANLYTLRDAFLDAVEAFNELATEIAAANVVKTTNVGEGVFQIPSSAVTTLNTAISTAQGVYDNSSVTSSEVSTAISDLQAAETTFKATVNAPAAGTKYYIKVATPEHAKLNNAWLLAAGDVTNNNPTGYTIKANNAPAAYFSQAYTFTQVSGNSYKISIDLDGTTVYLTNGTNNGSAADWKASQIQGTTDSEKAMAFKIVASSTAGAFNIYNTETNSTIACQSGGNIYTEAGPDFGGFNIFGATTCLKPR